MSGTARRTLWLLLCVELVALVFSLGIFLSSGESAEWHSVAVLLAFLIFVLTFSVVGVLLATRVPANPIGWIMLVAGFAFMLAGLTLGLAERSIDAGHTTGVVAWVAWASTWLWMVGTGFGVPLLLLLFPTGRLPSRRWRPVMIAAAVGMALTVITTALSPFDPEDSDIGGAVNPIALEDAGGLLDVLAAIGGILFPLGVIGAVVSLFFRYRGAGAEQRQQLKWLMYAAILCVTALMVETTTFGINEESEFATNIANTISAASIALMPIAIGIAILKYRLYDIDLIVNRTLVYGALTVILAVTYLGLVVLMQQVTSAITPSSDLAVAASTLTVAALFTPLRSRVQAFIDKRFYRRRFDARRTLEAFGTQLRDSVDLETLKGEIVGTLGRTLEPSHASLWLRES
jgi:hypothetical protein